MVGLRGIGDFRDGEDDGETGDSRDGEGIEGLPDLMGEEVLEEMVIWGMMIHCSHRMLY